MECQNCNKTNDADANYCVYCGHEFNAYVPKPKTEQSGEQQTQREQMSQSPTAESAISDNFAGGNTAQNGLLVGGIYLLVIKLIRRVLGSNLSLNEIEVISDILSFLTGAAPWVLAFFAKGKIRMALLAIGAISMLLTFFI